MADRLEGLMNYIRRGVVDHDFDCVILVDGPEGSGKSTLAMHCKAMFDGKYNLEYMCYDSRDLLEIMQKAPKASCVILDEAITSFMSRTSLDKFQVRLIQAFSIVREKNLVFILIIPNYGLMDKALLTRARYRFYVYPRGHRRGYCKIFYANRTEWTTGKPWYEESWHYVFPDLPDRIKAQYKRFKSKELNRKIKEYDDEIKYESERKEKEKRKVRGVKTQLIIDTIKTNPKMADVEVAKAAGCSIDWVKKTRPLALDE